ncbi:MAG: serine/threonine protein kinase [Alphaproteobacteria bacterium]|nr:serine/threonine protein kinase [Alphaproteobacteria bacterium]
MEGLQIGSFTVEAPLAQGGMGAVWRAVHRSGVPAALKIIPADAESTMFQAAVGLQAEIRAVGALDHPNIVRVYDAGTLTSEHEEASQGKLRAGSPWLAMELADGPIDTLQEGMDWSRLSNVLLQVLDGLAHAHARGMVHRDLKPANVLYTRGAGDLRVLLADFGLAWRFQRDDPLVHAGSLPYASPEQLLGLQTELGPWTDMYGLGCVAYRLATGKRPFRGKDPETIRRAHLFGDRPRLRPRFPVPEGFQAWVHGMMAQDPRARFQRAADAAWALVRLPPPALVPAEEEDDGDVPSVSVQALGGDRTATLPLSQWMLIGGREDLVASQAQRVRAPAPNDWRRPSDLRAVAMDGRGLGLFGLLDPPMVGRIDERNRLWEELTRTKGFRLVVLRGPQGVGKTRLASWLCERGHEVGVAEVFRATFRQSASGEAEGLAGLVEDHLRIQGVVGADLMRELQTVLKGEGVTDLVHATRLARLLRPTDEAFGDGPLPEEERLGTIADVVARRASGRRALVWLEDAFWSSEGVAFAERLAKRMAGSHVLVLLTMRDDLVAPAVVQRARRVMEEHGGAELRIGPLLQGQVAELVAALIPARGDLPERIEATAGGHPATAVRLTSELVDGGHLAGDAGGVWLTKGDLLPLPDDARWVDAVAELAAADPGLVRALRVAAALGPNVVYAEWRDACRVLDLALPQTAVAGLVDRGFLVAERRSSSRWTFAQEPLHRVLREQASAEGPELHLACAHALWSRGPAMAHRAAAHFEEARDPHHAVDAWLDAVRWLVDWDRARATDAAGHWRQVMEEVGAAHDPRWGVGVGLVIDLHALERGAAWREALADLAMIARRDKMAQLRSLLEQAAQDLEEGAIARATARAELAFARSRGTPLRTRAVILRADVRRVTGDAQGALEFLESWLPELDAEDQEVVLARARFTAATGRTADALGILTGFVDLQTRAQAPMARARVQHTRGRLLLALGRRAQAQAALEEANAMCTRAGYAWPELIADLASATVQRSASPALDDLVTAE